MMCKTCGDRPDLEYDEGRGNEEDGYTCWSCVENEKTTP
jgi:hypothetical protein|tara:strand:+ start:605 stop:721 length:117 start_codon:yes stop_codon:yes gene_type:complete